MIHSLGIAGVGGKSVRQENVSGVTEFPRKMCPPGQDILSIPGPSVPPIILRLPCDFFNAMHHNSFSSCCS